MDLADRLAGRSGTAMARGLIFARRHQRAPTESEAREIVVDLVGSHGEDERAELVRLCIVEAAREVEHPAPKPNGGPSFMVGPKR